VSEAQRTLWERRYSTGDYRPRLDPAPFLVEWLDRLPRGEALDVACGTGRNAMCLAAAGYKVVAVDISATAVERARVEAIERGLRVDWRVADIDALDLGEGSFDLVTVFRYTNRSLWPRLAAAIRPGGAIVVEHHLRTTRHVKGPADPEFRLAPGELLDVFGEMRIVFYSESIEQADRDDGVYALARMVAFAGEPVFIT
jgi:SAM-dependent methyltransferase